MRDWFVERREVTEVVYQRSGLRVQSPVLERGFAARQDVPGGSEQTWAEVAGGSLPAGALPSEVLTPARELLGPESPPWNESAATELVRRLVDTARAAGAAHLDVLLREVDQHTLFATESLQARDRRRYALLEVKAYHATEAGMAELWRCAARPDGAAMRAALPELEALVAGLARQLQECTPVVPCPTGPLPVVFPPGAASACFFHEVCGHPMEGDVIARGGSYLAHRLGQRVAEPFLSVSDNPTDGHGALAYSWDDEGQAAQPVHLIREGVVGAPLLDVRSAGALGRAPNGHGRRVGFKHPPLPRMAHTCVEPHQGSLEGLLADISYGLMIRHLTPRHMNLLSGDFSFSIVEAQEIRDGRLGRLVGPGILRGNGLEALAAIDAVGADFQNLFATRGCRKLNHGPLPVSFGQPTVRFRRLHVHP
ncbi:TldD/PmbA family protein [Vitiosangium sp. GDMCC 1.1324]|uniref:TldD/PmbA family protein n=1 Tax=Vitiosangium sp. (strain GDMCC 1.1324) TaxID=2138576 RepID=UPI001E349E5D|nr:metallopeptidase TldD-related protein [Vitiosangium sp. GDMCC 1.1324]